MVVLIYFLHRLLDCSLIQRIHRPDVLSAMKNAIVLWRILPLSIGCFVLKDQEFNQWSSAMCSLNRQWQHWNHHRCIPINCYRIQLHTNTRPPFPTAMIFKSTIRPTIGFILPNIDTFISPIFLKYNRWLKNNLTF